MLLISDGFIIVACPLKLTRGTCMSKNDLIYHNRTSLNICCETTSEHRIFNMR